MYHRGQKIGYISPSGVGCFHTTGIFSYGHAMLPVQANDYNYIVHCSTL